MSHQELSPDEPMGWTWTPWVLGWQWIVGGVLFVTPAYLLAGREVAAWVGLGVLGASLLVAWLSVEASRALRLEREADSRAPSAPPEPERSPTLS